MTFIDWIKKVERDRRVGSCFQSEDVFNACFHGLETVGVLTKGLFGLHSMPELVFVCRICKRNQGECTCFNDYHTGKLSTERVEFFIKHKF